MNRFARIFRTDTVFKQECDGLLYLKTHCRPFGAAPLQDDREFPARRHVDLADNFIGCANDMLLELFCVLAQHKNTAMRQHLRNISQQLNRTVWRFEPYDGVGFAFELCKVSSPFNSLARRKALKAKRADVESREDERSRHHAWSGQRIDRRSALARRSHEFSPRIGDAG